MASEIGYPLLDCVQLEKDIFLVMCGYVCLSEGCRLVPGVGTHTFLFIEKMACFCWPFCLRQTSFHQGHCCSHGHQSLKIKQLCVWTFPPKGSTEWDTHPCWRPQESLQGHCSIC